MSKVQFRPMLAVSAKVEDYKKINFPVYVSPKLDGIRAIVIDGVVYSRSLKPFPSKQIQELFGKPKYNGFDGELIVGSPTAEDAYNKTMAVMRHEIEPEIADQINFHVFDIIKELSYKERLDILNTLEIPSRIILVPHKLINNLDDLYAYEEEQLAKGFEGVMIRSPEGDYKQGRSTLKQQWLIKMKRFSDSEAEIIGITPLMKSVEGFKIDELGYRKTSSKKGDKEVQQTMGAITVRDLKTGVEFEIGSGFTAEQRLDFWANKYIGEIVKYSYFEVGAKDKPRFPTYLGFRSKDDM